MNSSSYTFTSHHLSQTKMLTVPVTDQHLIIIGHILFCHNILSSCLLGYPTSKVFSLSLQSIIFPITVCYIPFFHLCLFYYYHGWALCSMVILLIPSLLVLSFTALFISSLSLAKTCRLALLWWFCLNSPIFHGWFLSLIPLIMSTESKYLSIPSEAAFKRQAGLIHQALATFNTMCNLNVPGIVHLALLKIPPSVYVTIKIFKCAYPYFWHSSWCH